MDLKKQINLNKKFIIALILVNVIALGLYYSYALFTTNIIKNGVVAIKTATITTEVTGTGVSNNRITIPANSSSTVTINLTSNYSSTLLYKVFYKVISGDNTIKLSSSNVTTFGEINGSKSLTCVIENTGSSATTIEIGTKEGLVGSVIQLDNNTYPFEVLVTYEKGNLLYGLEDTDWITSDNNRMKYKIENGVVTVEALQDDGYGFTIGRVDLEANKTYVFSCDIDGMWAQSTGTDTVQTFLMLNGEYSLYYYMNDVAMNNNGKYEFTPTQTGTYWLRLDVNQEGQTHTFSNISIVEKEESKETRIVKYNDTYGELLTQESRDGYTFMGWNGKNMFNIDDFVETYAPYQNTKPEKVIFEGEEIWKIYGHVNENGRNLHYMEGEFKSNTPYAFSLDIYDVPVGDYVGMYLVLQNEQNIIGYSANRIVDANKWVHKYFISSNTDVLYLMVSYGTGSAYSYIKKWQIEEGTEETEYEPYYLTNTTKVTQTKDHTLKAIWEKNA